MDTIQISIAATEEQQEILISQLEDLGASGFEQTDTHLVAYFDELNFNSYDVEVILKPYQTATQTLEEKNWNEVWESNFPPVAVEGFCAIRADFHQSISGVEHEIIITPKMSFGTGHHATTYMMIEQMKDIPFTGKTVFDFGTGTGILAILAEKKGATAITAIDVDKWSIENARENFGKNGCSRISVALSSNLPEQNFDVVLANINRNVILQYLPHLKKILKRGSFLLLSGLLQTDEKDIVESCKEQNLRLVKQTERNNWVSLLMLNDLEGDVAN